MPDGLIATEFAGYRIDSRIGRGGMGVVYRATDLALERTVALKVLAEDLAQEPGFQRRFVTESRLAASLDHPNIVPIYAAGEFDGVFYIAMRFVPGDDLRTLLRLEGPVEPERAARLIAQVASALDVAHQHGLVHRDVKPANVLVTAEDHVYLTDFGLSKRVATDSDATRTGMVLGTLDYVAPEQIRGETIGAFTDIYSLGCMTVHLLTGQVPFTVGTEEGKLWAHFSEPPPAPSARVAELGTAFDAPVARAMAKLPQERYERAGELGAALVAAARTSVAAARTSVEAPPARAPATPAERGRGRPGVLTAALTDPFNVVLLAALLVVGAALGALALMVPLALVVYAAGVARSYFDPATAERVGRSERGDD
jgi:serine/threonine-protein kinase